MNVTKDLKDQLTCTSELYSSDGWARSRKVDTVFLKNGELLTEGSDATIAYNKFCITLMNLISIKDPLKQFKQIMTFSSMKDHHM